MSRTTVKRVLIGIWAVAFVLGAIGVLWRLRSEHADFGSYIPWGLWIALYAWFVGLSAGAYMLFAAGEVLRIERLRRIGRPALVIAFASLVSGLMIVGLDLGHLERFWHVYLYGNPTSLMAWEISFYTAFGVLLPVTLVLAFRNELARFRPFARFAGQPGVDSPWIRPLALVGGVLAVAVSGATGALFGVVGSRPYWHTGLLPLLFIAAALLSAAAVLTVFAALTAHEKDGDEGEVAFLGRLTLGFLAIATLIEWADVSIAWTQHSQTAAGWAAWDLVLTGPRWWVFWFVHVAAGVLVPVLLLLLRPRRITAVGVAAGLVAVTLVSVRLNVVIPGLAVPQIEGLDEAYAGPGLTFDYTPTLQEWLVSIFTGAFFGGLIGAWYRFVPVRLEAPAQPDALPAGGEGAETRGEFLGKVGIAGGALLASQLPLALHRLGEPGEETNSPVGATPYALARPENIVFSVCQQCNTQCGIKAKLVDGVLVKIDGNPYSPWTMKPPLPFDTPVAQAAAVDGWICPKGQAGIMAAYDPYRIRKVLKRDGPRGSGRWKTIEFDQAVAEIVEGGDHFGEGRVPGLAELWALRDPDLAKEMGADVKAIWDGKLTVAGFKTKHRPHLDVLIDPDHPDLGPKNNQVVFAWGRLKSGRAELLRRFIQESYGSVNAHGHTTVCQGSLYFAGKAMSEQWIDGKWQKGVKAYWQADAGEAEFVIFVGASPFEANYGPPYRTSQITDGLVSGRLKIAVVDPRLSKTAAKAWRWVPAKPGSEGALALALMRWIIENERYDAAFLRNANKAAAEANGEKTWTNASWLVHAAGENEGKLVRASEIGLGEVEERLDPKGNPYEYDQFVVLVDGRPVAVDPADEENAVVGDLVVDTTIRGSRVKSGFQVLTESARSQTLRQWAEVVGVDAALIVELAREFTSHGKKAAADVHRGVSQHTNGYSNVVAWNTLNALVGNYDWAGGMSKSTTYSVTADKDGEPIEGMPFFLTGMHPAKISPFGISSIRHDASYEKSTIFDDYPARRPWYPLSSDVYQEIVPSIGDAYPYSVKALFLYMGSPVYALPGGHTNIEILSDPKRLPLFVANDIVVGETSMYADYVFPDLSYLERWEFAGSHPNVVEKAQPLRQAGHRTADRERDGLRRGAAALVRGDALRARREARSPRLRAGRPRGRAAACATRGLLPADGGERRRRRQGRSRRARLGRGARAPHRVASAPACDGLRRRALPGDRRGRVVAAHGHRPPARRALRPGGTRRREAEERVRQAAQRLPGEDGQGGQRHDRRALPGRCRLHPRAALVARRGHRRRRLPAAAHHLPRDHAHEVEDGRQLLAPRPAPREPPPDQPDRRTRARVRRGGLGAPRVRDEPRGRVGARKRPDGADGREAEGHRRPPARRRRLLARARALGVRRPRHRCRRRHDRGRPPPRPRLPRQRGDAGRPAPEEHLPRRSHRRKRGLLRHLGQARARVGIRRRGEDGRLRLHLPERAGGG